MDGSLTWIFTALPSAVIALSGLVLIILGISNYLDLQSIEDTPASKVGGAAIGLVELSGKASGRKKLQSQMTGKDCVFSRVVFEKFDRMKNRWSTCSVSDKTAPFDLDDGTGRVMVDPDGARFDLYANASSMGDVFLRQDGSAALTPADINSEITSLDNQLSFGGLQDFVLSGANPGFLDSFLITGNVASSMEGGGPQVANIPPEAVNIFLAKNPNLASILRTSGPGWFRVSEHVIAFGKEIFILGSLGASSRRGINEGVIRRGHNVLLISDVSEKALAARKKKGAYLWILTGLGALSLSLALLVLL